MPESNTSHEKRFNKRALPVPEGLTGGEVRASKKARVGNATKQDLAKQLEEAKEMIAKLTGENKELKEAAAAEAERAKTKQNETKIPVPKRHKNQKGPAHCMGDIVELLKKMPDVDDAEEYYSSAQRYMKSAIRMAKLDLTRTYKNCQDEPEMATACRLIRHRFKAFSNFENDWASRGLIRQYMKSARSHARLKERKDKSRPKKQKVRKTILTDVAQSDEDEEGEGSSEEEEEEEEVGSDGEA